MNNLSPKVLIVSFDGGVWSNLKPIADAGLMPNLKRLLEQGKHENLESTIPPVTPPAWTAFMTGCHPGKSGVFDFYEYQEGTYKVSLTTSKSIQVPTLWKLLSDGGYRVGIIDVPINYPPSEVNGFIISGWERPTNKKTFTYPPELGAKLIEKLGSYPICLTTFDRKGLKDTDYLSSLIEITSKVGEAALWLLEEEKTDFFMVHFQTTDIIQHGFWREISTFNFSSEDPVLKKIWDFYRNLDLYLGKIIGKLNNESTFLLVSDHGFGPVKRRMAVNVWLMENGYLKLKGDINTQIQTKVRNTAVEMVNKIDALARLKNRIKKKSEEGSEQRILVPRASYDPIDYKETRAFSGIGTVYGTIQLNVIGRETEGVVPQNEAEALKDEIIQKLTNVKDPVTGVPFVKIIYRKEDTYNGPAICRIPDLIIVPNDGFYLFSGTMEKGLFHDASPLSYGNHISSGIITSFGKHTADFNLNSCSIVDLVPTILNIFRLKVPSYVDGKSLFVSRDAQLGVSTSV